jgi:hypothetical protein
MYDIYIYQAGKTLPEMNDLIDSFPELANQKTQLHTLHDSRKFLGLNLPFDIAKNLTRRLHTEAKASCQIIPTRYRDNEPKFTIETAYPIAEKALRELQTTKYPEIHFYPIIYTPGHSGIMYITFASGGKEWQDEGLIPGAIFASVDRLDGHLWTDEEMIELYR